MTLTLTDHERTVAVTAGSVLTVRLPENPGTGYRWTMDTAAGLEAAGTVSRARAGSAPRERGSCNSAPHGWARSTFG